MTKISAIAQDAIIDALVNKALILDEIGEPKVADGVRLHAVRMCKRWGISQVPGLPDTWPQPIQAYLAEA